NPQPRLFPPRSSEIVSIIDSGHDPRATRTTIAAVSPNRQTALGGGLQKANADTYKTHSNRRKSRPRISPFA
ncbi:hypothetical protein, partial [Methylocystis sp.]|uniref:hypothetical protein n=1 Tax=Methylocystis sp. TaxID=1911079 RepID=UPI003DA1CDDF